MDILTITLSMVSFVLTIISLPFTIFALVELRSFMKSTHKVEFVPVGDSIPLKKELRQDDELEKFDLV